jgi:hypothetical protein
MEYGYGDTVRYANSRVYYSQGKLKKEDKIWFPSLARTLAFEATHLGTLEAVPRSSRPGALWDQHAILVRAFRRTSAGQDHRTGSPTAGHPPPAFRHGQRVARSAALSSSNDGAVLVRGVLAGSQIGGSLRLDLNPCFNFIARVETECSLWLTNAIFSYCWFHSYCESPNRWPVFYWVSKNQIPDF